MTILKSKLKMTQGCKTIGEWWIQIMNNFSWAKMTMSYKPYGVSYSFHMEIDLQKREETVVLQSFYDRMTKNDWLEYKMHDGTYHELFQMAYHTEIIHLTLGLSCIRRSLSVQHQNTGHKSQAPSWIDLIKGVVYHSSATIYVYTSLMETNTNIR